MSDHYVCDICAATGGEDSKCTCPRKRIAPALACWPGVDSLGRAGQSYTVPRSGRMPLTFVGEQIAAADGNPGKAGQRWHSLHLLRTTAGKYVLAIAYRSTWRNEPDHYEAHIVDGPPEAEAVLLAYNPTEHVQGWPVGEQFAGKQARLLAEVKASYESLVSELMAKVPAFCERIA